MKDNPKDFLPRVDEDGNVLGRLTRGEAHGGGKELHPVVHLHLFDTQGRLYLQRRPAWKDIQPGKWDTAVGGHVDWGESVEKALRREVREEIGIESFAPEFVTRYVFESEVERELVHVYFSVSDAVPVPSDELDGGRFFAVEEIASRLGQNFFTPNFEQEWQRVVSVHLPGKD